LGNRDQADLLNLHTRSAAFWRGARHVPVSLMSYVLIGTFVGIGALAHDAGFDLLWTIVATVLVWAGPAQLILVASLASGASLVQVAIAVSLSGIRLLPMVVSLMPLLRTAKNSRRDLILPAHFTAVSFWVESMRMVPKVPRDLRLAFCNGFGITLMAATVSSTAIGHILADRLPPTFAIAVLFLTPIVFLLSMMHAARQAQDWLALALGLALMPLVGLLDTGIDLLIAGIVGGTLAFFIGRVLSARARRRKHDLAEDGGL